MDVKVVPEQLNAHQAIRAFALMLANELPQASAYPQATTVVERAALYEQFILNGKGK